MTAAPGHRHDRQQRTASASSNYGNNNNSSGRSQQQSPGITGQNIIHPTQLPVQTRNSAHSHTGSTSSSLNQPSPQDRQFSLNELKNELEVRQLLI